MTYFTRMELSAALHELGQLAVDAGKVIDHALAAFVSLEDLKPLLIAQSPLAFRRRMMFEHEPLRRRACRSRRLSACPGKGPPRT